MQTPRSDSNGLLTQTKGSAPGLLVSAQSMAEVRLLSQTDLQWLDLKDPSQGSLGRPAMELIRQLLEFDLPSTMRVSIAGGELSDWDNALNLRLLAQLPPRCHIKFGLSSADRFDWIDLLREVQSNLALPSQLIPVFYADQATAKCPDWLGLIKVASSIDCHYVLVDTHDKSLGNLLHHFSLNEISDLVKKAKGLGLEVALAGSLGVKELKRLFDVGALWLGVRGAVCNHHVRTDTIDPELVDHILSLFADFPHGMREGKL